jgi:hypothetical protein
MLSISNGMTGIPPRRIRGKRDTFAITYRLLRPVKDTVTKMSVESGKSENKQAEYLLMVGILTIKGIEVNDYSDLTIMQKFKELYESTYLTTED